MAGLYAYAAFEPGTRAPSIDTPLHALLPFAHIDHVHPDAVIALAAASGGEAAAKEIWGDAVGWTPWLRPGLRAGAAPAGAGRGQAGPARRDHGRPRPDLPGATAPRPATPTPCDLIGRAADYLNQRLAAGRGVRRRGDDGRCRRRARRGRREARAAAARAGRRCAAQDRPLRRLRRRRWSSSLRAKPAGWPQIGTSCPDHFLRTKIKPLLLDPARLAQDGEAYLAEAFAAYRADYAAYYERCREPASPPLRDANPVVVLHPRLGMFTLAKDKATARIASRVLSQRHQRHARRRGDRRLSRPAGAGSVRHRVLGAGGGQAAPPAAAGAAGGPHRPDHRRRRRHRPGGRRAAAGRRRLRGAGRPRRRRAGRRRSRSRRPFRRATACASTVMDVTDETAVAAGMAFAAREFGGLDILVANAGIASAALDRGDHAGDLAAQPRRPGRGLFPGLARGVPAAEGVRRRDRVRRLEERAGGRRSTPRPTPRPRPRRCTWPAAWRWKARRSASGSTWSIRTR